MKMFRNPREEQVKKLLSECDLPTSDISPNALESFFGCGPEQELHGVVGLEIHGAVALLRSLAVAETHRGAGFGKALVAKAEEYARSNGVTELYLLTITAERFFERLGYRRSARENSPEAIRQTTEFSSICPSTSVMMIKALTANPSQGRVLG